MSEEYELSLPRPEAVPPEDWPRCSQWFAEFVRRLTVRVNSAANLALFREHPHPPVVLLLTATPPGGDDVEDHTCDRCRRYVGEDLWPRGEWFSQTSEGPPNVLVAFGLCAGCMRAEGFTLPQEVEDR
jgi:hypothetical protein